MAREAVRDWLALSGRGALEPERCARRGDAEAVFLNARGGRLSRQGAWGVLSRGLLTRSMSFETALLAAFAPFYNPRVYA